MISLREGQLKQLERRGGAGARTLVRLARDPNRFLATIQIGITLAGFLASVRRIPVVDGGRPVGVLSLGDAAIEKDPNSALADISAAPANT